MTLQLPHTYMNLAIEMIVPLWSVIFWDDKLYTIYIQTIYLNYKSSSFGKFQLGPKFERINLLDH